jgi:membrane associated rhomboid family serine protease
MGYPARALLFDWGLVPAQIVRHPAEDAVNVLTSMFMHDPTSWVHIGGNMLFLWIFGDNVEDALGRGRYLAFYLLSGLAAATLQVVIDPSSPVPMVGASGAIAGVLAAYGSLYPRSPIAVDFVPPLGLLLGFLIELPAWVIILEFFVVNLFNALGMLGGVATGGVAFFAHVGGFIAGLFLVRAFLPRQAPRDHDRWDGFRPRRPPPSPYYGPYPTPPYPRAPRRRPWDD